MSWHDDGHRNHPDFNVSHSSSSVYAAWFTEHIWWYHHTDEGALVKIVRWIKHDFIYVNSLPPQQKAFFKGFFLSTKSDEKTKTKNILIRLSIYYFTTYSSLLQTYWFLLKMSMFHNVPQMQRYVVFLIDKWSLANVSQTGGKRAFVGSYFLPQIDTHLVCFYSMWDWLKINSSPQYSLLFRNMSACAEIWLTGFILVVFLRFLWTTMNLATQT